MRQSSTRVFLTYLSIFSVGCCTPTLAVPTQQIRSSLTITQLQSSRLDKRVKSIMEKQHIPGMAVVVIQNGRVQELKGYGVADIDTKQPVTADTKFPIGSIGKQFTAAAVMLLVEEGKVSLDAPISKYLSNLPSQWTALTLRQLMSHTAGISENVDFNSIKQPSDYLKAIDPKLDFPPGESWAYSNSGYYLAGLIIERISGKPYSEFMRDRIFTPLGMQQTQAKLVEFSNLSTGYVIGSKQSILPPRSRPTPIPDEEDDSLARADLMEDRVAYAAGNIISTANDMAKWVQALDRGELLSAASYQQLWTATRLKNGRIAGGGYGLGWVVGSTNGHPYTQHGGNVYGHSTGLFRFPKDRLDTIILTNKGIVPGDLIANAIASVYDSDLDLFDRLYQPQPDPQPELTQKFLDFLQGRTTNLTFAPEWSMELKTPRRSGYAREIAKYRRVEKLEFLTAVDKDGDRVYNYRFSSNGKLFLLVVRMTKQQQIARFGTIAPAY
jgi:D-alanyl-D-alanine carboxypeptidase